jgi:hypothetical protein
LGETADIGKPFIENEAMDWRSQQVSPSYRAMFPIYSFQRPGMLDSKQKLHSSPRIVQAVARGLAR